MWLKLLWCRLHMPHKSYKSCCERAILQLSSYAKAAQNCLIWLPNSSTYFCSYKLHYKSNVSLDIYVYMYMYIFETIMYMCCHNDEKNQKDKVCRANFSILLMLNNVCEWWNLQYLYIVITMPRENIITVKA